MRNLLLVFFLSFFTLISFSQKLSKEKQELELQKKNKTDRAKKQNKSREDRLQKRQKTLKEEGNESPSQQSSSFLSSKRSKPRHTSKSKNNIT